MSTKQLRRDETVERQDEKGDQRDLHPPHLCAVRAGWADRDNVSSIAKSPSRQAETQHTMDTSYEKTEDWHW